MFRQLAAALFGFFGLIASISAVNAHPHVFVEANIEMLRNNDGLFTELRQVWRFDELFSATITIDFDEDGNGKLDEKELSKVTAIIKESIAEYDFYTAIRIDGKPAEFYEPEELNAYFEDDQMIILLAVELSKPYDFSKGPVRVSASDTSFYVAFDFDVDNLSIDGNKSGCTTEVVHPDFDKLYADSSMSLTESFFSNPEQPASLGDEFYSWATIDCK